MKTVRVILPLLLALTAPFRAVAATLPGHDIAGAQVRPYFAGG